MQAAAAWVHHLRGLHHKLRSEVRALRDRQSPAVALLMAAAAAQKQQAIEDAAEAAAIAATAVSQALRIENLPLPPATPQASFVHWPEREPLA